MTYFKILSLVFACLVVEVIMQWFVPGKLWLTPAMLIIVSIKDKNLISDFVALLIAAVVIDLFSGLPLGIFTTSYLIFLFSLLVAENFVVFRRSSLPFVMVATLIASLEVVSIIFLINYVIGQISNSNF